MKLTPARLLGTLIPLTGVLSGCERGVLDPAGPIGQSERTILLDSVAIMLAIVVPTILCTLAVAWWYRASNSRAAYAPHWAESGRLELLVWSIPALVVLFLGSIAWISSHELDPAKPLRSSVKPLEVEVVALDWKWLFIYPDQHIASINRLVTPVDTPVHFRLTASSVFNVFWVPQLGSEIYAMNGMATELYLAADRVGTFLGVAGHFNGDGFSDMTFDAQAMSAENFSQWVASVQASGPMLDESAYRALLPQTSHVAPYTYRSVTPRLFDGIVSQHLPPGEGPRVAGRVDKPIELTNAPRNGGN
ncbi:MAG: ubiquinol oxidase subunit II [Sinobacteraceae bacterium]|nr:ubiquinol oxidase subunit II [Nevskiaceae bacterium]